MTSVLVASFRRSAPLSPSLPFSPCGRSMTHLRLFALTHSHPLSLTLTYSRTHSGSSCSFGLLAVLVSSWIRVHLIQSCSTFAFCTSLICIRIIPIIPVSAPLFFSHARLEGITRFEPLAMRTPPSE
ncbi:hypothetical protein CGRA01v4_01715 [Colletotrichum graminicola]|nr:hypothetical protein CGRA01v4_01715 [Colletotrichum graminicola]